MKRILLTIAGLLLAAQGLAQATFQPIGPLGFQQTALASTGTISPYAAHVLYAGAGGGNLTLPLISTTGIEQIIVIDNPSNGTLTLNTSGSQGTNGTVTTSVTVPANSIAIAESYISGGTPYWGVMTPGSGSSFSTLGGGTNTTAAMLVGTGASLGPTGTGTLSANQVNGAAVPASAAVVASNSSKQLTALTLGANIVVSGTVLGTAQAINAQTGTSYAMLAGDAGKLVTFSNASAIAVSLSQATTAGFTAGYSFDVQNLGAGTVTITGATSTINGAATLVVTTGQGCTLSSDGTNYQVSACTAALSTGGGNVSNSGTPAVHQTGVWVSATTIKGVGPGTTGQAFASTGASTDPGFSASLSGVTSVNGSIVPASTTLAGLGTAETWTALQTFTNSDIALLGSSTGMTTFFSANAGASNFTLTFPAITDTLVALTATQTLTNKSIAASEVNSGTLAAAQMPALTGDCTTSSGAVATTCTKINGVTVPSSAGMVSTTSSGQIQAQAIVTDAAPGAGPTNDYSPSGFGSTTGVLYITPTAGGSTFNGMVAQSNLQQVYIVNAEAAGGADLLKLVNQSASDTTAANRFLTSATTSLGIPAGGRVLCIYLAGSINRWNCQ